MRNVEQGVTLIGRQQAIQNAQAAAGNAVPQIGDGFAQVFFNMMQSAQAQDGNNELMQLLQNLSPQGTQEQEQENQAAMEWMAMLLQAGIPLETLQKVMPQEGMLAVHAHQPTKQISQYNQVPSTLPEIKQQTQPVMQIVDLLQGVETKEQQVDVKQLFAQQLELLQTRQSVQDAKNNLPAEEIEIDADTLQAQAQNQQHFLNEQLKLEQIQPQKMPAQPVEPPLKQVTDQMQFHLKEGKREFTIRLNPENLGEITVRLLQKDGKMVLSLTAVSEKTASLLNQDLAALQEAVRPMKVEVHDAVVQTATTNGENMQQSMDMNMNNGQFSSQSGQMQQQMQQEHQQNREAARSWAQWLGEELATPEQAVQAAKIIADNSIDIYL